MRLSTQKNIGSNLRILRVHKDLSQVTMAEIAGITRSLYVQYELGNRTPDAESLYEVSVYFGIDMALLFESDPDKFIAEAAISAICKDGLNDLVINYNQLSPFSKGRLLERSEELLEWDRVKERNFRKLQKTIRAE